MAGFDPLLAARDTLWPPREGEEGHPNVEQLFELFKGHELKEREALLEYREAIEQASNPMAAFLLNLIRLDEEKHSEMIHAMIATFEKNLYWTKPPEALDLFREAGADPDRLLPLVEKFIRLEQEGIKEYKSLLRATKKMYRGLFSVLLHSVIKDSEKHLLFLEYLQKYLSRSSNARGA